MTRRIIAVVGTCIVLGVCLRVRAELTAFWQNNPITPQAITDDPTLANMQSWSVITTNTEGFFATAGLRAVLPSAGTFYRHRDGGDFRPTIAQQNTHPALAFHTYVTQPAHNPITGIAPPSILGGFPFGEQLSFGGSLDGIPGTFSVAWGDPSGHTHPAGVFEIARITFPTGILPTIHPESQVSYTPPVQTTLIPTSIPEPAVARIAIGATWWLMLR